MSYTALEVSRLVFVNDIAFGELVEHSRYLGEEFLRRLFVGGVAKSPHCVAGGLVVIFVTKPSYVGLTDSFLG